MFDFGTSASDLEQEIRLTTLDDFRNWLQLGLAARERT